MDWHLLQYILQMSALFIEHYDKLQLQLTCFNLNLSPNSLLRASNSLRSNLLRRNSPSNGHLSILHYPDSFFAFPFVPALFLLIPCSLSDLLGPRSRAVGSFLCTCKNAHSWFFTCFGQTFCTIFTFSSHTLCLPVAFEGMHHIPVLLLDSFSDTFPVPSLVSISFVSASQNFLAVLLPPN